MEEFNVETFDTIVAEIKNTLRIPVKPATDSALNRPPVPVQTGHPAARL